MAGRWQWVTTQLGIGMNLSGRNQIQRKWRRLLAGAAVIVMAAGLCTVAVSGETTAQNAATQAPYRYVTGAAVAADDLGALAPLAERDIVVHEARVLSAEDEPWASFKVAQTEHGPVGFDWQPEVTTPFLRILPLPEVTADLAAVLKRHVPDGGTVFAWWDVSRQLRALAGLQVAFGEHFGVPLYTSRKWQELRQQIEAVEAQFWQPDVDSAQRQRFERFVHALLAPPQQGVAELKALADGKPAIFVLHVRDIIALGKMAPEKMGVAFRDFTDSGNIHGMVNTVRDWVTDHDYAAYSVIKASDPNVIRAVALLDEASEQTLIARLLPFIGNDRSTVPGTILVYATGGFRVYQLGATPKEATPDNSDGEQV